MANAYPTAGSAYAYVSREIHTAAGYLTGWSMLYDYVMNPIICVIWCSKATVDLHVLPFIPVQVWFVAYAVLFTGLNLRGIEANARTNTVLAVGLGVVILLFFFYAIRYLMQTASMDVTACGRPSSDPATFSWNAISCGAALAVLTYAGFDRISTRPEQ